MTPTTDWREVFVEQWSHRVKRTHVRPQVGRSLIKGRVKRPWSFVYHRASHSLLPRRSKVQRNYICWESIGFRSITTQCVLISPCSPPLAKYISFSSVHRTHTLHLTSALPHVLLLRLSGAVQWLSILAGVSDFRQCFLDGDQLILWFHLFALYLSAVLANLCIIFTKVFAYTLYKMSRSAWLRIYPNFLKSSYSLG